MYTYIHKSISDYVALYKELDVLSNEIATDWDGYLKGGWLLLSEDQLAFNESNPNASKEEVWNMELKPIIPPVPHVPTKEEKTMELMSILIPTTINTIEMDNNTALFYQEFHPHWKTLIGKKAVISPVPTRVNDGDTLYECVQEHTVQSDWAPSLTPALWKKVSLEEFPEWEQPLGAHDAYKMGDKVAHNDKKWESNMDGNVFEPGVAGWNEIQ